MPGALTCTSNLASGQAVRPSGGGSGGGVGAAQTALRLACNVCYPRTNHRQMQQRPSCSIPALCNCCFCSAAWHPTRGPSRLVVASSPGPPACRIRNSRSPGLAHPPSGAARSLHSPAGRIYTQSPPGPAPLICLSSLLLCQLRNLDISSTTPPLLSISSSRVIVSIILTRLHPLITLSSLQDDWT